MGARLESLKTARGIFNRDENGAEAFQFQLKKRIAYEPTTFIYNTSKYAVALRGGLIPSGMGVG